MTQHNDDQLINFREAYLQQKQDKDTFSPMTRVLGQREISLRVYSTQDVADYFGVCSGTVLNWIKRGWLFAHNDGPHTWNWVTSDEIDRIERRMREILPDTKRIWVRTVFYHDHEMKIR